MAKGGDGTGAGGSSAFRLFSARSLAVGQVYYDDATPPAPRKNRRESSAGRVDPIVQVVLHGCANLNSNNRHWSLEAVQAVRDAWKLSEREYDDLFLLGERLNDLSDYWKNTPGQVVRFLRARPNDVNAAEQMFRNMVRWRKENKIDTLLEDYDPPEELVSYLPVGLLADVDRDGDPILVQRVGVTDGPGLMHHFGHEEMVRHAIWEREAVARGEWAEGYERRRGHPVHRITIVVDLYGFSLSTHMHREGMAMFKQVMRIDQDYYPETAKRLILIRAPAVFRVAWGIVKHFFDPGVVEKMIFAGHSNYLQVLRRYVDLEVLPSCIVGPEGKGRIAEGMHETNFEGGKFKSNKNNKNNNAK